MCTKANDSLSTVADAIQEEAGYLTRNGSEPAMQLAESLSRIAGNIRNQLAPRGTARAVHIASPADWAELTGLCGSRTGPFTLGTHLATCGECQRENEHGEFPHKYQDAGDSG